MRYKEPNIGDNRVFYKGKRYWVIELTGKDNIDGFDSKFRQFIMYDRLDAAFIATIVKTASGKFRSSLISHVELWYDFNDMPEVIRMTPGCANSYYKSCIG